MVACLTDIFDHNCMMTDSVFCNYDSAQQHRLTCCILCCLCLPAVQVAYELLSPLHAARNPPPNLAAFMPRVLLLHGTTDKSVPVASSLLLNDALTAAGVDCSVQLLPGKTHTDLLLEDALGGGRDVLSDSILSCITGREEVSDHPSMCPKLLVRLAGCVCPF
jgi:prenylcysteine alpha-carboxyl methylesterase